MNEIIPFRHVVFHQLPTFCHSGSHFMSTTPEITSAGQWFIQLVLLRAGNRNWCSDILDLFRKGQWPVGDWFVWPVSHRRKCGTSHSRPPLVYCTESLFETASVVGWSELWCGATTPLGLVHAARRTGFRACLDWRWKIFGCHIRYVERMSGEVFKN